MLKNTVIFLTLILWPLNLILNNNFPKTVPKTIFVKDYQAEQKILRDINLYPNVLSARIFQNKGRIYLNKFVNNFFALIDPNNYFFGFHPRPIVPDNKNIFKFPFIAIIFFFYGLYAFQKYKYRSRLMVFSFLMLLILSILKNFDGYDIVLWIPVSLVIIHGVNTMERKNRKIFTAVAITFIIFAIPEIIRSFIVT